MWMLGGMLDDMPDDGRDERAHPELAAALERELVVKRGKPMFGSMETRPIDTTGMSAFSATKALEAIRVWVINDAVEDGQPVVTGMAFRYRGDEAFQPAAAPDADHDARLRSRDPFVFEADELVLAPGERVTRVVWTYGEPEFVCEMEFTTSLGRVKTFGRGGTEVPYQSFDHSEGGAALCGFVGSREVIAPYVDYRGAVMGGIDNPPAIDIFGGAPFYPLAVYFSNAWNRRGHLVLLRTLCEKGRATPDDELWPRLLALPQDAWRHLMYLV